MWRGMRLNLSDGICSPTIDPVTASGQVTPTGTRVLRLFSNCLNDGVDRVWVTVTPTGFDPITFYFDKDCRGRAGGTCSDVWTLPCL
jgi:hypothetical protein